MGKQTDLELVDSRDPRKSRRSILLGGAGILGGLAVGAVATATGPAPAGADDGDSLILGSTSNTAKDTTLLGYDNAPGLSVVGRTGPAYACIVNVGNGVVAETTDAAAAIAGYSSSGEGIYAQAGSSSGTNPGGTPNGVHGVSDSPTDSGVWGENVGAGYGIAGATTSDGGGPAACQGLNGGSGPGVYGSSAGHGVQGLSTSFDGIGVVGQNSAAGIAVWGQTSGSSAPAIIGENDGTGQGILGVSNGGAGVEGDAPDATGAVGVFGHADGAATGVLGIATGLGFAVSGTDGGAGRGIAVLANVANAENVSPALFASTAGKGNAVYASVTDASSKSAAVFGATAGNGSGLYGEASLSASGTGVTGTSKTGTGVHAESTSGKALSVSGKVSFSRSGLATVVAGHSSVTVKLAGVTTASLVLATLQNLEAGITVAAAVPASGSFEISLTGSPKSKVTVAWFVID
jgi:hypothetical protein